MQMMWRALRIGAGVALFAFLAGFAVFTERTTRHVPPDPVPRADGVVALTGGGGARLAAGVALLDAGAADRLLITGVNPSTTDEDVRRLANGDAGLFDCCVDIDRAARTTVGNAQEAAAWARAHGYASLIVVTSDFHMPRTLIELRHALGGATLHAYPVRRADIVGRPWWRDPVAMRRLVVEYLKYLLILARSAPAAAGNTSSAPAAGEAA